MNQAAKRWLITAAVLLLLGILLFVGVMTVCDWDFHALNGKEYAQSGVTVYDDFDGISVAAGTEELSFLLSEDGSCRVEFYEEKNAELFAGVENGTLAIRAVQKKWYRDFSFGVGEASYIRVYLPETEYGALSVDLDTGSVSIPEGFAFSDADIVTDTGSIDCRADVAGQLYIKTDTGLVRVRDASLGQLRIIGQTGPIELDNIVCESDANVDVETGKVTLKDLSCNSLYSYGDTGELAMENVLAREMMSLKRDTGAIRFEDCDAAELDIETDTGAIRGTLLSDKVFIAHSDTGRVDVPETTSGGKCKVTTDTGSIVITISK